MKKQMIALLSLSAALCSLAYADSDLPKPDEAVVAQTAAAELPAGERVEVASCNGKCSDSLFSFFSLFA
jgi:hypothetical protein